MCQLLDQLKDDLDKLNKKRVKTLAKVTASKTETLSSNSINSNTKTNQDESQNANEENIDSLSHLNTTSLKFNTTSQINQTDLTEINSKKN